MAMSMTNAVMTVSKRGSIQEDGFIGHKDERIPEQVRRVSITKEGSIAYSRKGSESSSDDSSIGGTFGKTAGLTQFYKPIDTYEGRHRWDPEFQWEEKEEARLVRKIDFKIMAWCCFTFFALQLDRGNLVQAVSDNMLVDLKLNTNDYNNGNMIFYLAFLCAELPSQAIGKKLGPDTWIPCQMVLWSIVAAAQALMNGKTSFYLCRFLLGLFEGGFVPDTILYLSYWYTSVELPKRLSFFWTMYESTSIISAFLAYGLLHMRGIHGLSGWKWLFALEGTLTGLIGIASFFYLPPSPTQTASKVRGKGWFNEREEKIMVNRVLRDDPSKGDMHNRQPLTFNLVWQAMKDTDMWPIYVIGLSWLLPTIPMTSYLTLTLKSLHFTTFQSNLLSIPAYCIFIINLLFWTWVSERTNQRLLTCLISQFWNLPMLIALEVLAPKAYWSRYAVTILLVGSPYVHAIIVSLTSRNAGSVRTRTVASALYNCSVQFSNVLASQVYRNNDKPIYHKGNAGLIVVACFNIGAFVFAKLFYVRRNKQRDEVWNRMTIEEKSQYLLTTEDKGNRRLDFRFAS